MIVHKNTRLLPKQKLDIFDKYHNRNKKVTELADEYHVSRVTIYKVLRQVRAREYLPKKSINRRYRTVQYGIKRLAKIEKKLELKLKNEARRYNKSYPGEMVHVDTVRLPLLRGESKVTHKFQYLFVGIDDYSRELYAAIMPDKTSNSARDFLDQMLEECPYTIECIYSDNGTEYKGNLLEHPFMITCERHKMKQRYTKVKTPQTNGKAERVIRTLKSMWHRKEEFASREHRKLSLNRFINYYNTVKPHASLENKTPLEVLIGYFYEGATIDLNLKSVNNA